MKFELDKKAMQDLEKRLSATVEVPAGSEADAIRSVQQQYKSNTGIELDVATARNIVREARGD